MVSCYKQEDDINIACAIIIGQTCLNGVVKGTPWGDFLVMLCHHSSQYEGCTLTFGMLPTGSNKI